MIAVKTTFPGQEVDGDAVGGAEWEEESEYEEHHLIKPFAQFRVH